MSDQRKNLTSDAPYTLDKELTLAIDLARQAGTLVQQIRAKGYQVYDKGKHLGLVTDADRAVSKLLLKEISQIFPQDLIISEEEPRSQKISFANRIWFIDPIDGTKDFIDGSTEWSVMLGLAIKGNSCLGVVYQPDSDELYYAIKNRGAFYTHSHSNGVMNIKVNTISDPTQAILIQSRSHWSPTAEQIAKQFGIKRTLKYGSIGLKLGKIAKGDADLYFNFSGHCHLWDLCGPEIILQEAGGKLILASGEDLTYGPGETIVKDSFLAANNELANKIYPAFKGI